MNILDKLTEQFNLPNEKECTQYVPFDSIAGNFEIISARSYFGLLLSQKIHATNIQETVSQMRSREKTFDGVTEDDMDDESTTGGHEDDQDGCASHNT